MYECQRCGNIILPDRGYETECQRCGSKAAFRAKMGRSRCQRCNQLHGRCPGQYCFECAEVVGGEDDAILIKFTVLVRRSFNENAEVCGSFVSGMFHASALVRDPAGLGEVARHCTSVRLVRGHRGWSLSAELTREQGLAIK